VDRRTTLKWVLAAGASWPALRSAALAAPVTHGYGTDPNLLAIYAPGKLWPLTLSAPQRELAGILADLIIPADEHSPSASAVGVVDFIDEWVSAPYPDNRRDRPIVLGGFRWLNAESARRGGTTFARLDTRQQQQICEAICYVPRAAPPVLKAARFFARYRDLTAGAFYSSAAGRQDLGYIGNVPLARFDGPPVELLQKLKLL
jgi:Gluconate 2-dehydrogenase subunit 3